MTPAMVAAPGSVAASATATTALRPESLATAPLARPSPLAPETPARPLPSVLAQPAQAAARQDSQLPLLQTLAALPARMPGFPPVVVEAARQLLANRLPLERGGPTAEALRTAVARAGVVAATGQSAPPGDVKAALLQLRQGLMSMLEGGAIAAITPVSRRPPPPLRDAQPRALRAEAPTLPEGANARETARSLLGQTESALARLKLTQLASSPPPDASRAAAALPPTDFMVELPMMLGSELSLAQLQVQRDGSNRTKKSGRGWRVRFAVSFSAIGEVGAQVSLLGGTTNVVIWAESEATADALEEMLPELGPALGARGLTVGSVRVRRGIPADAAPATGRLMDTLR